MHLLAGFPMEPLGSGTLSPQMADVNSLSHAVSDHRADHPSLSGEP